MAYGSSTTISYLGAMAAGAMADGLGFKPATQGIAPLIQAAANGNNAKTSSARVSTNADATTIDTLCRRDISGSGAFTGVVPEIYARKAGIIGKIHGATKDPRPASNAIPIVSSAIWGYPNFYFKGLFHIFY